MKTVDLVYFNAGGGHRATALALQDSIARLGWPWTVRLVNLFELLDPNDAFRRVTGFAPEAVYNQRLASGWTLGLAQELKLLQAAIRYAHPTLLRLLRQHWAASEPDLVVSLVPNFNRAMGEAVIFITFGPLLMLGAAWAQTGRLDLTVLLLSIPAGLGTTPIVTSNNYRDRDEDGRAGIRTLGQVAHGRLVRAMYLFLVAGAACLPAAWATGTPAAFRLNIAFKASP